MDKFLNKYRIPSARLQNWDYGGNGAYFITICTQNRTHYFGEIVDAQFITTEIGQLAQKYWLEIPNQFPFVELGNFVVMPNHTHGILIIDKNKNVPNVETQFIASEITNETVQTQFIASEITDANVTDANVETRLIASLPNNNQTKINGGVAGNKNPMFHENISRIIRWYKGRCSFEIRKIHADFAWQPRFHDHIIRDAQSFENIQNYIENNPLNWNKDKFYGTE